MPVGKHTDPQIKEDTINEIRNNGLPVVDAVNKYNVHPKTEIAYRVIGRATAEMQCPKR
jgi:hypothetical protein